MSHAKNYLTCVMFTRVVVACVLDELKMLIGNESTVKGMTRYILMYATRIAYSALAVDTPWRVHCERDTFASVEVRIFPDYDAIALLNGVTEGSGLICHEIEMGHGY